MRLLLVLFDTSTLVLDADEFKVCSFLFLLPKSLVFFRRSFVEGAQDQGRERFLRAPARCSRKYFSSLAAFRRLISLSFARWLLFFASGSDRSSLLLFFSSSLLSECGLKVPMYCPALCFCLLVPLSTRSLFERSYVPYLPSTPSDPCASLTSVCV